MAENKFIKLRFYPKLNDFLPKELIIEAEVPAKAKQYYQRFYRCNHCKKIFWEGSHYVKMRLFIRSIIG